jgi:lysophospholipase L1-like esterase
MPPSSQVSDLYLYDKHPFLGSVLEPRKVLYPTNPDSQGTLISINRWGFRGQDFAVPKSSGIFRIAAIGGSTTFGTKLNDDETWPTCLEKELRSQGKAVEVLNFGVPGYSSIEELILLESNVLDLRPDVVVIYAGYNDLKYNRAPASGPFASDYSHFKRVPFRESTIRTFLNRNSALWLAAVTKVNALKIRGSDNYLGRTGPRYDSIDPAGVKAFSRNLDSIISICVSKGMAVVLVSEARSFDAETQASDDLRRNAGSALYWVPQFSTKGLTEGFIEYAEAMADVVQRAARNEVVPVLYFDAHSRMPRDPDYYWDSVHMNRSGSELLAGLLAPTVSEAIEKLIILKEEK